MASVKVAVRVRPFNKRELSMSSGLVVDVKGNQVCLKLPSEDGISNNLPLPGQQGISTSTPNRGAAKVSTTAAPDNAKKSHKFSFDYAYWSHNPEDTHFADQSLVFRDLGIGVVDNAFNGYNVCVFAYGQTGSGKTYTMMGSEGGTGDIGGGLVNDADEGSIGTDNPILDETCDPSDRGLIPRICSSLFKRMAVEGNKMEGTTYRTEVSYLEIYNEKVKDLLASSSSSNDVGHKLKVREHPKDGPYVENLSKHLVMNYREILALMEKGNKVRTTASTAMNDTSSRSHSIFTITFVHAGFDAETGLPYETVSKIHLVDLAGSERADATGATGKRLKEGAHINKSLVTLGSVISALAEVSSGAEGNAKKSHFIPYRDSVLTWLLKDSLGGNSKTIMIATISPAEVNKGETLSTLRYANRAKNIINKPTVNEDVNVKLIRELRAEIDRLKSIVTIDPIAQRKLAAKEAQERHLTEEWAEKWKEAANILKEQSALALKRTGWGVVLDSDKPHLIGIDEDVLSTGIALYHLKDGDTVIGGEDVVNMNNENDDTSRSPDIVLKGPNILSPVHCIIHLSSGEGGTAILEPMVGALCIVNAVTVTTPTCLSQGCVLVLGRTNMFRYNDPREAAKMRLNISKSKANGAVTLLNHNRSLLSQSLSDLRISTNNSLSLAQNHNANDLGIHEIDFDDGSLAEKTSDHQVENILNASYNNKSNVNHNKCNDYLNDNENVNDASATMYSKQFNQHSVISDNSKTNQLSNGSGTMCKIEALNDSAISNSKNVDTSNCIENTSDGTNTSSVNNSSDISYFDKNIPKHEKERMPIVQSSEEEKDENLLSGDNNLKIVEKRIRITTPESGESSDMTTSHESECSSASSIQEIVKLYEQIGEQKETVMKCLENEGCDVSDLDEQISLLKEMQKRYAVMEFDHARSLWQSNRSTDGSISDIAISSDCDAPFSRIIEQEVDRRLFQEKIMRSETEFQEKEMLRMEQERELAAVRRQHEREIYLLKKQLHEATINKSQQKRVLDLQSENQKLDISISIPTFSLKGLGSSQHVEYDVDISIGGDTPAAWSITRRYRQFRDLHRTLAHAYGTTVHCLSFPSRRLFGNRSNHIATERKRLLQTYLNALIQTCAHLKPCPLSKGLNKVALIEFSSFFEDDVYDSDLSVANQSLEQKLNDSIPSSPRSENSE